MVIQMIIFPIFLFSCKNGGVGDLRPSSTLALSRIIPRLLKYDYINPDSIRCIPWQIQLFIIPASRMKPMTAC